MDLLQEEKHTMKITKILKEPRVIILLFFLLMAFLAIDYNFGDKGIVVGSVDSNSSAAMAGMLSASSDTKLTAREKIFSVNNKEVDNINDFSILVDSIPLNSSFRISTSKQTYVLIKNSDDIGITPVKEASSNLRKGLELQGGTRVLLRPEDKVSDDQMKDLIATMERRLNVYGLSDLSIKSASDLEGNKYIVVEIAGATKEEVKNLVASQGKFEAKIGDKTVFEGGNKDITHVCRTDGTCSRIITPCSRSAEGIGCRFEFEISLSDEAASRHADITKDLSINTTASGQKILEKTIDFYLDGIMVDSLQVDSSLKGNKATRIVISGPGFGSTEKEAITNAIANRDKLQTVLITGSLPTKLSVEKVDSISPSLGEAFLKNALLVGILAVIGVLLVIYIRYRIFKIVIPIMITVFSEIFIILGFSALFKNNIDIAAIAGIIAAIGTGVNDQIVITDDIVKGNPDEVKANIKKAFFIIMVAYFTAVAAMLPLLRAGAGLLTGFAIATIVGVTGGVLITRPAFSVIMKHLMSKD
ncbi:hypothetical protein J4476_05080 [Candidatus Woesearchaeota archaeon]|nr:MAG: preprotein translocase subunit SecD [archaeon GW2011_AR18]MBS3162037.1 hypothetical protein [Candidatus Woesearchaeota archaeon]HIH25924.1 hypothetical protein [Nanoarchaeota archaeon]